MSRNPQRDRKERQKRLRRSKMAALHGYTSDPSQLSKREQQSRQASIQEFKKKDNEFKQFIDDSEPVLLADWVYGWKFAGLALKLDGSVVLYAGNHISALDATAKCLRGQQHAEGISLFCSCGFYAYNIRPDDRSEYAMRGALLRVALSGTIFEHEYGYRAERQVVTDLWLDNNCRHWLKDFQCHRPASTLTPVSGWLSSGYLVLDPRCPEHQVMGHTITLDELTQRSDITITWHNE